MYNIHKIREQYKIPFTAYLAPLSCQTEYNARVARPQSTILYMSKSIFMMPILYEFFVFLLHYNPSGSHYFSDMDALKRRATRTDFAFLSHLKSRLMQCWRHIMSMYLDL